MARDPSDADRAVAARIVGRFPPPPDVMVTAIAQALATARAEERAACAAVVEGLHRDAGDGLVGQTFTVTVALCAAAIRARGGVDDGKA